KNDLTESKQEVEKEITKLKEQKEEYVAKGNDLEALEARVEEEINSNESRSENEQIVQTATTTETSTSNPVEPESQVTESTSSKSEERRVGKECGARWSRAQCRER